MLAYVEQQTNLIPIIALSNEFSLQKNWWESHGIRTEQKSNWRHLLIHYNPNIYKNIKEA